ncbi:hypothetical protein [Streptacidiphilus sp. PAMC 29251]
MRAEPSRAEPVRAEPSRAEPVQRSGTVVPPHTHLVSLTGPQLRTTLAEVLAERN